MSGVTILVVALKYNREYQELPGIILDLYNIYHFSKKINASKIHFITDIVENEDKREINKAFLKGEVDGDAKELIENLKKQNLLSPYTKDCNKDWLLQTMFMEISLSQNNKLIFYYSGHCENYKLLLPRGDNVHHSELTLFWKKFVDFEIIQIYDCCDGVELKLPYILSDGKWKDRNIDDICYYKSKIWCLTATQIGQTTNNSIIFGSYFTRNLFRIIKDMNTQIDINNFITKIQEECNKNKKTEQNCTAYCSEPFSMLLPLWILGINLEIKEHPFDKLVTITF